MRGICSQCSELPQPSPMMQKNEQLRGTDFERCGLSEEALAGAVALGSIMLLRLLLLLLRIDAARSRSVIETELHASPVRRSHHLSHPTIHSLTNEALIEVRLVRSFKESLAPAG